MYARLLFSAAGLLAAASVPVSAQVGIKAGLSFATLSESSASPDFRNQTGFAMGVSLGLPRGNNLFQVQPEALYVQKGAKSGALDTKIAFLDLPLLLRLNFPTPGLAPFAVAGPLFSIRLNCTVGQEDCSQDFGRTDYGVALGGGVRLGGPVGFTVEGRYTLGLKDINQVSEGFDNKTRTFMVLAGIAF